MMDLLFKLDLYVFKPYFKIIVDLGKFKGLDIAVAMDWEYYDKLCAGIDYSLNVLNFQIEVGYESHECATGIF